MDGYQPKKVCDNCLSFYICKMAKKAREGKDACKRYKEIPPPPPPKTTSNAIKKANENPKALYLCDRKACKRAFPNGCNVGHYCKHTTKIEHAVNFKVENGVWIEQGSMPVKKIVVVKINRLLPNHTTDDIKKWFIEQAKTGLVVVDGSFEIYNVDIPDDINDTQIKVEKID